MVTGWVFTCVGLTIELIRLVVTVHVAIALLVERQALTEVTFKLKDITFIQRIVFRVGVCVGVVCVCVCVFVYEKLEER